MIIQNIMNLLDPKGECDSRIERVIDCLDKERVKTVSISFPKGCEKGVLSVEIGYEFREDGLDVLQPVRNALSQESREDDDLCMHYSYGLCHLNDLFLGIDGLKLFVTCD